MARCQCWSGSSSVIVVVLILLHTSLVVRCLLICLSPANCAVRSCSRGNSMRKAGMAHVSHRVRVFACSRVRLLAFYGTCIHIFFRLQAWQPCSFFGRPRNFLVRKWQSVSRNNRVLG
ncbi:hypothetical protein V1509DRAFT_621329 [Lipomyces kononenkoae]